MLSTAHTQGDILPPTFPVALLQPVLLAHRTARAVTALHVGRQKICPD